MRVQYSDCIYVIDCQSRIKIGVSNDALVRFKQLKNCMPHPEIATLFFWTRIYRPGKAAPVYARDIEQAVFRRLALYRVHGEWFEISPEAAKATIENVVKEYEYTFEPPPAKIPLTEDEKIIKKEYYARLRQCGETWKRNRQVAQ